MYGRYDSTLSQECNRSVTKGRKGKGFAEWSAPKDKRRESGRERQKDRWKEAKSKILMIYRNFDSNTMPGKARKAWGDSQCQCNYASAHRPRLRRKLRLKRSDSSQTETQSDGTQSAVTERIGANLKFSYHLFISNSHSMAVKGNTFKHFELWSLNHIYSQ